MKLNLDFFRLFKNDKNLELKPLQSELKYKFQSIELLKMALTHKSYTFEQGFEVNLSNERLEFLGDAVLDLAISDFLMSTYADANEGQLSRRRASLVNEKKLSELAIKLDLQKYLFLGKAEIRDNIASNTRILSSALEALLGAIYLDGGYSACFQVCQKLFEDDVKIDIHIDRLYTDFKTQLQESAQRVYKQTPTYELVDTSGPDHDRTFICKVLVGADKTALGSGRSKKEAEHIAAKKMLEEINEI